MNETPKNKSGWRSFVVKIFRWLFLIVGAVATFTAGQFLIRRFTENSVPAEKTLYTLVNLIAIAFCLWLLSPVFRWIFPPFIRLTKCFFSMLFTWRMMRRISIGIAILATLIAIFYSEEDWRGKRAWENCKRELEAKGETLDWNAYIPPPVPDDQNFFKAPKMQEWFVKNLHATTNELMILMTNVETTVVITDKTAATNFLAWSDQFQSDFDLIRDALKRPYTRMDGDYSQPSDMPIPHFVNMRSVAQVLAQRAKCYLLLGQPEKALNELTLLNNSRRLLEAAPTGKPMTLVAAMINVAVTGLYVDTIADGMWLHAWQESQLAAIQEQLTEINLIPFVLAALQEGRAAACHEIEIIPPSKFFNVVHEMRPINDDHTPKLLIVVDCLWPRGWTYQNMVNVAVLELKPLDGFDLTHDIIEPRTFDDATRNLGNFLDRKSPFKLLAAITIPNLTKAEQSTAYNQTQANEAQIVCAVERYRLAHGEYPETLDALTPQFIEKIPHDIIGGQPLHYRRTSDGQFVLYSVGWNEKDDGGQVALTKGGSVDPENGDWVWQYPQK